jgi:hypothetical protein
MGILLCVKPAKEYAKANGIWWFRRDGRCHGEEGEEGEERDWV